MLSLIDLPQKFGVLSASCNGPAHRQRSGSTGRALAASPIPLKELLTSLQTGLQGRVLLHAPYIEMLAGLADLHVDNRNRVAL